MKAATYDHKGRAADVLRVIDMPAAQAGPGEVLVRVAYSGVNPSDVKARAGVGGAPMEHALVVPHSDGAGVIEAVGDGVPRERLGQAVWTFNAQWQRPFGTAAEFVSLPAEQAVALPPGVTPQVGASVGIPLMTAYHAVSACGSLLGKTVLVFGAVGAVGTYVTQLAAMSGARVIAVVSSAERAARARELGAAWTLERTRDDVVAGVQELTEGRGVDALIDVDAAANARHYGGLLRFGGQAVIYGSGQANIELPFRPLIAGFASLYFFIVYRLPVEARREVIAGIGSLLERDALRHPRPIVFELDAVAQAHEAVEAGADGKVLLRL